jgi:pimeloyl-ACP methyl ester carboxylesterase
MSLRSYVLLLALPVTLIARTVIADPPVRTEARDDNVPSIDELLLFFPSKYPTGNWKPDDLRFEDVWFESGDKTRLHGWHCPCDKARATMLVAHGNAGSVASRASWLRYCQTRLRVTTLIFDYRGYGRSEGIATVEGALLDARAARAKLCELEGVKDEQMLLVGESLGGAFVVQLAAESAPRGLILQSTFSSLRELADFHYPKFSWLVSPKKLDSVAQRTASSESRGYGPDDPICLWERAL